MGQNSKMTGNFFFIAIARDMPIAKFTTFHLPRITHHISSEYVVKVLTFGYQPNQLLSSRRAVTYTIGKENPKLISRCFTVELLRGGHYF